MSSLGRYTGAGAFLVPLYGSAELPQAFCRSAVRTHTLIHLHHVYMLTHTTTGGGGVYLRVAPSSGSARHRPRHPPRDWHPPGWQLRRELHRPSCARCLPGWVHRRHGSDCGWLCLQDAPLRVHHGRVPAPRQAASAGHHPAGGGARLRVHVSGEGPPVWAERLLEPRGAAGTQSAHRCYAPWIETVMLACRGAMWSSSPSTLTAREALERQPRLLPLPPVTPCSRWLPRCWTRHQQHLWMTATAERQGSRTSDGPCSRPTSTPARRRAASLPTWRCVLAQGWSRTCARL